MKKVLVVFALTMFALTLGTSALGQGNDPAITATRVFGKITEINAPAGQMTVKTDAGSVVTVNLSAKTTYERMPVGETDRSKAIKIALTDIAVGDGVYARGYVSEDRKAVPAQQIIVVSQSDIAKKQDKERAEWRQRGLSGIIESVNPQTKEITVTTRAAEGPKPVIVPVTDKVKMRRYAPDSVKFSDAKKSSFEELKVGDQFRAKGDKSPDGARFNPEEIVTGSFRTIGGSVTAVDAATGEIKISDIQSKQPLTVVVRKDSTLKRVPAEFMQMMMQGGPGGPGAGAPGGAAPAAGGPGGAQPQGGARPAGGPSGAAPQGGPRPAGGPPAGAPQGGPGGPGGGAPANGGGFDIQRIIDNLPAATLAELKPGEMVLISSTTGADPSRVTAITLVAGVEPIFAMIQARQGGPSNRPPNLGTINIGIGGP
jgi:co-chaperonin GroES (HSP10)